MKEKKSFIITLHFAWLCICFHIFLQLACAANTHAATVKNYHPRLFLNGSTQAEGEADFARIRLQLQPGGIYHHAYTQALAAQYNNNARRYGGEYMLRMLKAIVDENGDRAQFINDAKNRITPPVSSYYTSSFEAVWILAMFDWFHNQWDTQDIANLIDFFEGTLRVENDSGRSIWNNHFHSGSVIELVLPGLVLAGESVQVSAGEVKTGEVLWAGNGMNTINGQGIMGSAYWMDNELKPVYNQLSGSYGVSHEGNSYWRVSHAYLPTVAMAWTSCTNENLFIGNNWTMANINRGLLYMWRSDDGGIFSYGDGASYVMGNESTSDRMVTYGAGTRTTFMTLLPFMRWGNDPYSAFFYDMFDIPDYLATIDTGDTGTGYSDIFIRYLWGAVFAPHDNTGPLNRPTPVDTGNLPKSVYFDGYNGVVIRSGWADNNVLFGYKQNRLIAGHDHMDAGSFVLSRGDDDLALDTGYYSSHGDILDDHTENYYPRTIAHNTLTVEAPGQETHVQWWSPARNVDNTDGGQRGFGSPGSYDKPQFYSEALDPKYDRGQIARFEYNASEGYTYFTGDVTPAYFSEEGDPEDLADNESVDNFTRTVLTPDALHYIILDRVSSTSENYPKRWILHTENELEAIDGAKGSQDSTDGSIVYSGGSEFFTESGSSRLFVRMLAPENNDTDTVIFRGGSGYENWYGYDGSGHNAYSSRTTGAWRIEEKIEGETDSVFLNVLYATDSSTATIGHAELMPSSYNVLAVELENYACVFSKPETKSGSYLEDGNYTIVSSQVTSHIITDLHGGTAYDIYRDDSLLTGSPFASSEKGIITFAATGTGSYRVVLNGVPSTVTAEFSASTTTVVLGQNVQFTDTSTGGPTSWSWDFDNNGLIDSTLQNPSYTYPDLGTYTVSLTVTSGGQSDTEIKTDFITVGREEDISPESKMLFYMPAILAGQQTTR